MTLDGRDDDEVVGLEFDQVATDYDGLLERQARLRRAGQVEQAPRVDRDPQEAP